MKLGLSLAVLLAATIVVPVAGATRGWSSPACGDVVTTNVTLTKSLKNCASGLVVGADNVTIDLNGRSIRGLGDGTGVGIDVTGRTGVTVKNGTISDFAEGVKLFNTSNSTVERLVIRRAVTGIRLARTDNGTDGNEILDNKVRDSGDGIVAFGAASSRIAGNTLADLTGTGILCRDTFTSDAEIVGNRSVRNDIGIRLLFCGASVERNIASENVTAGIFRTRSNGSTLLNVANRNGGIGIHHDDSHGVIAGNVTNHNTGIGLAIEDQSPDHGPLHTVTGNRASWNGGFGIMTNLTGVVDGGCNWARHNGDPLECKGVACG
jgi:parallel beta-helix repeat protein